MGNHKNKDDIEDNKYVIFSVFSNLNARPVNIKRHSDVKIMFEFRGIGYKELYGCYKGEHEFSFIVNQEHLKFIEELAKQYDQEAILLLSEANQHNMRHGYLKYLNGSPGQDLGYFRSVSKDKALREDSYTYDFTNNKYFMCFPTYEDALYQRSR